MSARPGQIAELKAAIARAEARAPRPTYGVNDVATVRRVVAAEIGRLAGTPAEHVRANMRLREDLGLQVIDVLELVLALEERLQLTRTIEAAGLHTVGDLVAACPTD